MLINNQPANRTLCASHTDVFPLNQFSRTVCGHVFSVQFPSCFVASTLNRQKINKYVFFSLVCDACACLYEYRQGPHTFHNPSPSFITLFMGLALFAFPFSLSYMYSLCPGFFQRMHAMCHAMPSHA